MGERISAADLTARLAGRARELCAALGLAVRQDGPELHGLKREAGGPGDSFSIRWAGQKAGVWHHRSAGVGGDALGLVKWALSCEIGPACDWAREFLGLEAGKPLPPLPPRPPIRDDDPARAIRRRDFAHAIWRYTRPIAGTPAEAYLRRRGIACPLPASLRFHPAVRHAETKSAAYPKGRAFPCLVARVEDVAGNFVGVWRLYLETDGRKLGGVEKAKLGLGEVAGGSVALTPWGRRTYVTEGIETGLAVAQRWPGEAVRAALSTGGMIGLQFPPLVEEALYCADRDAADPREYLESANPRTGEIVQLANPMFGKRPGEEAAKRAAERSRQDGRRAGIIVPGTGDGTDFLDAFGGS